MLTAMLAVENIFGARHDIWSVNVEAEYHEQGGAAPATGRDAPVLDRRVLDEQRVPRRAKAGLTDSAA